MIPQCKHILMRARTCEDVGIIYVRLIGISVGVMHTTFYRELPLMLFILMKLLDLKISGVYLYKDDCC